MSTSITRSLMGLAFASSLFLGCEQFTGGDKEGGKNLDVTPPEDMALQLSVKQTDECRALRDRVLAARNGGEPTGDLEAGFIRDCIEEVKPVDGRPNLVLPPDLVPDPRTRCHWIVAQIDGGHDELIIKFKYYCPDDCDTLARTDSLIHDRYCRDPKPDCEELRRKLATMDPASEEFARLKRFLDGNCGIKPPIDTIIRPKPVGYCDSLRHLLVLGFLDSASLHRVHRQLAEKCGRDTILPPKPIGYCDSLHRLLASGTLDSAALSRIKHEFMEKCQRDTILPPKPILNCDSLRRLMNSGSISTEDSIRVSILLWEKCGRDTILPPKPIGYCDSLRHLLASGTLDSATLSRIKHEFMEKCQRDTLLPPKPIVSCDSLRRLLESGTLDSAGIYRVRRQIAEHCGIVTLPLTCSQMKDQMSRLDPASAEYARLKSLFSQKCMIEPPVSDCEAYRAKLANLDPASPDYERLKALVAEKCAVIQPVR